MSAAAAAQGKIASSVGYLSGWARQGVESFVAAQKILLELTAQQNALAIGVLRERIKLPQIAPGAFLADMADQSVAGFTSAGKILLDLASAETSLIAEGIKDGLHLAPVGGAIADVIHQRVESLIEMNKRLLDTTAEQTHAAIESYKDGAGLQAGAHASELARQAIEDFVRIEKKFLDILSDEVTAVADGAKERKTRSRKMTQLAREAAGHYFEAQQKLFDLAVHQVELAGKAGKRIEAAAEAEMAEPRTSFAEITQKTVHNFVSAQKALMDVAVRPTKKPIPTPGGPAASPGPTRRAPRRRAAKTPTKEAVASA